MTTPRSLAALAAAAILASLAAAAPPAVAHQSPVGCAANGLAAAIAGAPIAARNGDTFDLTASVGNLGANACDVSNATVTLLLPSADGTPNTGQAVIVGTALTYSAGQPFVARPAVPYTTDFDDGVFRSPATVEIDGTLHSGPGDGPADYANSVDVVISRPHVSLAVTPTPATGFAPLPVTYTYVATNDSPVDPAPGAVQPGVVDPAVTNDRCAPVTLTSGDTDGDAVLDQGEAWRYSCTTVVGDGLHLDTATFTGTSALDGRPWPTATAQAVVTATTPIPPPPLPPEGAPVLRLRPISPTRFGAARSGPSITTTRTNGIGTRVAFTLSKPSIVRFTVDRRRPGRSSAQRWARIPGAFGFAATRGSQTLRFSGRVRGRRLAPGGYRLTAVARDTRGARSAPARAWFTVQR